MYFKYINLIQFKFYFEIYNLQINFLLNNHFNYHQNISYPKVLLEKNNKHF